MLKKAPSADIRSFLKAIYRAAAHPEPGNDAQLSLLLAQALTCAVASAEETGRDPNQAAIERVIAHINRFPGDESTIAEMAKAASLSEYHFIRVFRRMVGVTPRQYLIAARMNQAKYLLAHTDLPVSDIARRVGYASESMFCLTFKRTQNATPTAYRTGKEETT